MPEARSSPNTRTLVTPNVVSEAKPAAAMRPAVSMTGPTATTARTTASVLSPTRAYSS